MSAVLFALLTTVSTTVGGLAAIRLRDRVHLLLGFSAGAVLGVVFFDIFPELIDRVDTLSLSLSTMMVVVVAGFLSFFLLERLTALHGAREHEHHAGESHRLELGVVGAAGLSLHSFLDGVAIGAGFGANFTIGVLISTAVLTHDFSDGFNTVTVVLAHGRSLRSAARWLLIDATTPVLGAVSVLVFGIPQSVLPYILAFFVGFFLYIGSSDLLPEARQHDSPLVAVAAVAGLVVIYVAVRLVS
jgi:ZIP family zinc transporter